MRSTDNDIAFPTTLKAMAGQLGEPFAKALAVFLREASPDASRDLVKRLEASPKMEAAVQAHRRKVIKEHDELAKRGKREVLDFDDIPRPKRTLRDIARAQGMSQKQLAERAGMDPAAVSRVLKNPDRSRVATVKRIAKVLNVSIGDVV